MIISPKGNFAIGHIPKTGGHALALMLVKADYDPNLEHPFAIKGDNVRATIVNKHITFQNVHPRLLEGKDLYLVFRRIESWFVSVMWNQSKHTIINAENKVQKIGIRQTYSKEYKRKSGFLFLPNFACHSTFPDYTLNKHAFVKNVKWLRMEHLREDVKKHLNINLPKIPKITTYDPPDHEFYWTEPSLEALYRNNPNWISLQRQLYK